MLAAALGLMAHRNQDGQTRAEFHVINPKSVTMGQLYGQVGTMCAMTVTIQDIVAR